jgi:hypothetical protein
MTMSVLLLHMLVALAASPPPDTVPAESHEQQHVAVSFLGWSPKSNEYAFTRSVKTFVQGTHTDTRELHYVHRVLSGTQFENRQLELPIRHYLVNEGFERSGLRAERVDHLETRFSLGPRRYIAFKLILSEGLGYQLSLFDGNGAVLLDEGRFRDVHTDVSAEIFPSPDRRKLIFVIKAGSVYARRDRIKLLRVTL